MTDTSIGSVPVVVCPSCGRRTRVPPVAPGRPRCGHCGTDQAGRIKPVKVDVDGAPGLARRFEVQAVPTLLLDDGRVVAREVGAEAAGLAGAGARPVRVRWRSGS